LPLTHTQGFNPRPSVSIALPLSVGVGSYCELLDFDLDGEKVPCDEICNRLNDVLIPGIKVLDVYDNGRKLKELTYLDCAVVLQYDTPVSNGTLDEIQNLFTQESLIVPKKGKNGVQYQDIMPLIRELMVFDSGEYSLSIRAVVCCQNPSLNPMQLAAALELYLPQHKPKYFRYTRMEIFDANMNVFR
jgi:radical SAM-linked protein